MSNFDSKKMEETLHFLRSFDMNAPHTPEELKNALGRYRALSGYFSGQSVNPNLCNTSWDELYRFEQKFKPLLV